MSGELTLIAGDPVGIRGHASRFTRTANAISDAVALLKAVQDASGDQRSEAVSALAGRIGDTRDRLSQLRERYEVAGSALTDFADVLEDAQLRGNTAISQVQQAESRARTNDYWVAEAKDARNSTVDPVELQQATDAAVRYGNAAAVARTDAAASRISETIGGDGLNDSGWDNLLDWVNENASWLKIVKDALTVVTAIIGVLSIFFPALAVVALALGALTAVLGFLLASSGDGSWLDFALDIVGVLTFGVGSAALAGVKLGGVALRGARSLTLATRNPGAVWG